MGGFAATVGRGELLLAAGVLVWPVVASVLVAVRGVPRSAAWRPFAWTALAAAVFALVAAAASFVLFATNGTTRAMAALGPQIVAGLSLLGAVICGLVAIVLTMTTARDRDRAGGRRP